MNIFELRVLTHSREAIMSIVRLFLIVLLSVLVAGCVTSKPNITPALLQELSKPLICTNEQECGLMWNRASFFVSRHAGFKTKIHNDTTIQTFNPTKGAEGLALSITREPLGNGQYRIWTAAACANASSCESRKYEMIVRAKNYIRSGKVQ